MKKIKNKISCGQVGITFVKAAGQLKIVFGYLRSDFSHTRELNQTYRKLGTKLLQAVSANERRNLQTVIAPP